MEINILHTYMFIIKYSTYALYITIVNNFWYNNNNNSKTIYTADKRIVKYILNEPRVKLLKKNYTIKI